MPPLALFACSLGLLFLVRRFLAYRQAVAAINHHPGSIHFLSPASILGNTLPRIKYFSPGGNAHFVDKHQPFEDAGCDVLSTSALVPFRVALDIADAALIKEITSSRARFPKPVHYYELLTFFGRNIIASEGEEWKKYRKISAPAFSDRNNSLVWSESVKTVKEMFTDLWTDRDVITVDHCVDITLPIALFIIGAAGFGRRISWKEDVVVPPGYTMPFKDALHTVALDTFVKLVVPDPLLGVTKRTRNCRAAFTDLRNYMAAMIHERQNAEKVERHDLFSSLLEANNDSLGSGVLTESELIGM
jgi:cytochrome P450